MSAADRRLVPLYRAMEAAGLDAAAFVPGPNFRRLLGRDFHLMERPLVVIIPATGAPVAVVPNLEMASFETLALPGEVFDWRDEAAPQTPSPQPAGHCLGSAAARALVWKPSACGSSS